MRDVREVYMEMDDWLKREELKHEAHQGQEEDYYYFHVGSYEPLLASFGHTILLQVDDSDYQGDSRILFLNDKNEYGLLIFGWGSCSGCDALQACSSWKEVTELRDGMADATLWLPKKEMLSYLRTHDWDGDWTGHDENTKKFVAKAIKMLEKNAES